MSGFLLAACHSDEIHLAPNITVEGQELNFIGYVANQSEVENNEPPSVYEDVEPYTIKPNTIIELNYEDVPQKILLKQWTNNKLEKEEELSDYSFASPSEEGIYVINISQRWNFRTASSVVIVLNVKQ